jgi:hypothetical protein
MIVCVVLLLNFTASNPTGRRYSSGTVDLSLSPPEKGVEGEYLLTQDLGLALTNERTDQAICLCGTVYENSVPTECSRCEVVTSEISNFRIPDIVTDTYIAESKNTYNLLVQGNRHNILQITDFAAAARALGRPLWIYVRVDTLVDKQFLELARSTGGDVVYYFRVPGWVDPVDEAAKQGLLVSTSLFILLFLIGRIRFPQPKSSPNPHRSPGKKDHLTDPIASVDETENFLKRAERRSKRILHDEE